MENKIGETIIALEKKMWDAFNRGDSEDFRALVLPEALMIIGGGRMSGEYYAQAISGVKINSVHLDDFHIIPLSEESVLISYLASVDGGPGAEDLSGVYRVSSVWVRRGADWKIIINQDSIAVGR